MFVVLPALIFLIHFSRSSLTLETVKAARLLSTYQNGKASKNVLVV